MKKRLFCKDYCCMTSSFFPLITPIYKGKAVLLYRSNAMPFQINPIFNKLDFHPFTGIHYSHNVLRDENTEPEWLRRTVDGGCFAIGSVERWEERGSPPLTLVMHVKRRGQPVKVLSTYCVSMCSGCTLLWGCKGMNLLSVYEGTCSVWGFILQEQILYTIILGEQRT